MTNERTRLKRIGTVVGLLFAASLSLFAWDFRPTSFTFLSMVPFLLSIAPAALVLAVTVLARVFPVAGAFAYLGLGGWYISLLTRAIDWKLYIVMLGPIMLLAFLFFMVAWKGRAEPEPVKMPAS